MKRPPSESKRDKRGFKLAELYVWRVGRKVPLNVYDGDRPVCQCHTEEDARRIVEAVNAFKS